MPSRDDPPLLINAARPLRSIAERTSEIANDLRDMPDELDAKTGHWEGDRKQTSVWDIPIVHATAGIVDDGTQKPVECMRSPPELPFSDAAVDT